MSNRKPVHLSPEAYEFVCKLAGERELSVGDAADHMVRVGHTRIKALTKYTRRVRKQRKEAN